MNNLNSFISESLLKVDEKLRPNIASHVDQLDRLSNDIKVLESKLKLAAIPFTFILIFDTESSKFKESGTDYIQYIDHCIVWGQNSEKEYRLLYNQYFAIDELEKFNHDDKELERVHESKPSLNSSKPLIECKTTIRLRSEPHLAYFYERIGELLNSHSKSKEVIIEVSCLFWKGPALLEQRAIYL